MLDLLLKHGDEIVAASNFVAAIVLFLTGYFFAQYVYEKSRWRWSAMDPVTRICAGASIEAFAWALHREYWWLWRVMRAWDRPDSAQWFVDNAVLFTTPLVALVCVGLSLIVSPLLEHYFKRLWPLAAASIVGGLFAVGIVISRV